MAPNYLLSYARSTVSELVTKGGFPPFLLPLVTFEALHARAAHSRPLRSSRCRHGQLRRAAHRVTTVDDAAAEAVARPRSPCSAPGSWGTALAVHLARTGHRAMLWGSRPMNAMRWRGDRAEPSLPAGRRASRRRSSRVRSRAAVRDGRELLIAVPSHALPRMPRAPEAAAAARACASPGPPRASSSTTGKLPHQVANEVLGARVPTAVLSGPTFAREVGLGPAHRHDRRLARRATTPGAGARPLAA